MLLSRLIAGMACLLATHLLPGAAAAQEEWVPGSTYDSAIPTIQEVLGFTPPAQFTSFYETEKLLHRWAEASDRARLVTYGEDYEGKKLYMLVVSSPENLAALDTHVENLGELADPRQLRDGAPEGSVQNNPAQGMHNRQNS